MKFIGLNGPQIGNPLCFQRILENNHTFTAVMIKTHLNSLVERHN